MDSCEVNNKITLLFQYSFFFSCLHTKFLLVTQFLNPDTQTAEAHTKSAKPYTNYWPLTQFSNS